jgi:hypothetical protein
MLSLFQLSFGYFLSYIATGIFIKLFTGRADEGFLGLNTIEYLVYSTVFSSLLCVAVVLIRGWHRRGKLLPAEKISLFLSGACTAYIIPSSTLIMSLPISIMIAMVLMRGTVIVASRLVDLILNLQRLQKKRVSWQEEMAVVLSIAAIAVKLFFSSGSDSRFPFLGIALLSCYFFAYFLRLYIMNRTKILGVAGSTKLDQRLYFGTEQLFASGTLFLISLPLLLWLHAHYNTAGATGKQFVDSVFQPSAHWITAALSGTPYALIAFLSVFLFLYPGKTATFTGVLNRLVSLLGGTASSLALYLFFSGKFPPLVDWVSLTFILGAISFLAWGDWAERSRRASNSLIRR